MMITPDAMYRLAYISLLIGTGIELVLFFSYGLLLMFYADDPRELNEIRENFIASAVSLIILGIIWGTNGHVIDWLLGVS